MISRRRLLQSGLSLAALPSWARAASDSALKTATGPDWAPWTAPTPALVLPDLGGRDGVAVLRLSFTGQGRPDGVPLQALAALGPGATLLHGGLDRLRGHAQGSLLVSVPAGALQVEATRAALLADHIKVLGYVAANA